jgi:L-alanine-DL-glutamate epimerase-like enolase superfamily enzyme
MRIHEIDALPIEIPLKKNFGGSTYSVLTRCTVITRIRTDDGLVSEVYNGDNREQGREIARLIREALAPAVRGLSIFEGERVWEAMFALTHTSRDRKVLLEAIPHGTYAECFADPERDPVWQAVWANRPAIKDGTMEVGEGPGFGLVLDESLIQRYRVA